MRFCLELFSFILFVVLLTFLNVFAPLLDNLSGMYDDCRDTTEDDNDEKEDDWHMVTKDWVGGLLGAYST